MGFLSDLRDTLRGAPDSGSASQVSEATSQPPATLAGSATLKGTGDFDVNVVGESNYVPALLKLAGVRRSETKTEIDDFRVLVALVPEPDNPHDPNAVAVVGDAGRKLGYLCREDADECCESLRGWSAPPTCWAEIGGCHRDGKWIIGVRLDLDFDQF